jgi:hypothetical protein
MPYLDMKTLDTVKSTVIFVANTAYARIEHPRTLAALGASFPTALHCLFVGE